MSVQIVSTTILTRYGDDGSDDPVPSLPDEPVGVTETSEHQLHQVRGQVGLKGTATLLHHMLQCPITQTHTCTYTHTLTHTHTQCVFVGIHVSRIEMD